jgi:hypothetical protein
LIIAFARNLDLDAEFYVSDGPPSDGEAGINDGGEPSISSRLTSTTLANGTRTLASCSEGLRTVEW